MGRTPDLPQLQGQEHCMCQGHNSSITLCMQLRLTASVLALHESIFLRGLQPSSGFGVLPLRNVMTVLNHFCLEKSTTIALHMQTEKSNLKADLRKWSTCKMAGCIVRTSFVVLANLCQVFNVMYLRTDNAQQGCGNPTTGQLER